MNIEHRMLIQNTIPDICYFYIIYLDSYKLSLLKKERKWIELLKIKNLLDLIAENYGICTLTRVVVSSTYL
jgi:hypothetical protein